MEYKVVHGMNSAALATVVNEEIKKGYKPQGGIIEAKKGGFYQAMIKE